MSIDTSLLLEELSEEDRAQLRGAFRVWSEAGIENPAIPFGDLDGDGKVEAWSLDSNGELTVISLPLEDTVYVSDGSGEEVGTGS